MALLTPLHAAARTLIWTLIGLGLALVLFMLRLDAGPVELGWLQPRIERALTPESGAVTVTAGRIELRLNQDRRTLELVGVDVRYRANDGGEAGSRPFLTFPEVELALSVEALLKHGMIAASEVRARAPSLIVTRDADGIIGLYSEAEYADDAAAVDFGGFLRGFALGSEADARLGFLERLQIEGARVALYDRGSASAMTARKADMALSRREEGGVDAWLRAEIPQTTSGPASVQLSAHIAPDAAMLPFEIDVADLMPADLPALWPLASPSIPAELSGLRLPVRATITGEIGLDGRLTPLKVDMQAGAGTVDLPAYLAEPLEVGSLTLEAAVDGDFGGAVIDHATVVSRGADLSASGSAAWRAGGHALQLELAAHDVLARDLPAFWPPGLGSKARAWVVRNIEAGRVSTASASLDLRPDDWTGALPPDDAIDGSFAFEGLSVRYIDQMPPIVEGAGRAVFDADRMDFEIEAGTNAGVTLTGGSVTISGMGKPGRLDTRLRVLAKAESSIERMLALLDHPPLEAAKELEIAPGDIAGSVVTALEVRLPLHADVTEEEAVILAEAELSDLAIDRLPKLGGGVRLDQGAFSMSVDETSVHLDGKAAVNGIPLAIDVIEPLVEDQAQARRIGLAGRLDRSQLEALAVPVDGIEGEVGFEATVSETATHFWIDLEADLSALALAPPGVAWRKPAGQEGVLRASIAKAIDGPLEVKHVDVSTGDLAAEGALRLSAGGLETLTFERLRVADSEVAIRYAPDDQGGHDLVVEGARLNLDTLLGDQTAAEDSFGRLHVILRTGELRARGIELRDVEADAVHGDRGWRSASLIGTLPSNGKVALELTPDGDDRRLEVRSENAGALIEALDLGQRVEGGGLQLSARLRSQEPMVADGRFEVTNFILRDAPLLARMLTLASLTGIGNLLGGEGIRVDHLILPFALDQRALTLTDGLMRGSELGLTVKGGFDRQRETLDFAGTIIPVYTLNRLLGKVPLLGRILTGSDGLGAFAATYSIEGPKDAPTVYVNPLSILAPGLLRDIFGAVISGTGEPPDLRETDD